MQMVLGVPCEQKSSEHDLDAARVSTSFYNNKATSPVEVVDEYSIPK